MPHPMLNSHPCFLLIITKPLMCCYIFKIIYFLSIISDEVGLSLASQLANNIVLYPLNFVLPWKDCSHPEEIITFGPHPVK